MPTTLDGRPVDLQAACDEPLRAYLLRVAEQCSGRMIVAVRVDGVDLVDGELAERLVCPLAGDEAIDLESAAPHEVAAGALSVIASNLRQSADALPELADLNADDPRRSTALCAYLDIWRQCQESIVATGQLLQRDPGAMRASEDDGPIGVRLAELIIKLRELRDAFEANDAVLLGDLLRYEWPDLSCEWADRLDGLATDLQAEARV